MSEAQNLSSEHDGPNIWSRIVSRFDRFSRYFQSKKNTYQYDKLISDDVKNEKEQSISYFQLFRFADRIDYLLMFIGLIGALVQAGSYTASLVLFSQLTGSFAAISFFGSCEPEQAYVTGTYPMSNRCSLDIDINALNYDQLKWLCKEPNLETSTFPTSSAPQVQSQLVILIQWLLITSAMQCVGTFLENYGFRTTAKRQASHISVQLFQSITQRNMPYFDTNAVGQLQTKLFENVETIGRGMGFDLCLMLESSITAVMSIILTFVFNWKLTLIMMCSLPFIIGGSYLFSVITTRETMKELASYSQAGEIAQEVFSSIRTVFSLNGTEFEKRRYEKELATTISSSTRKSITLGIYLGWSYFIIYVIYATGFMFGLILMHDSSNQSKYLSNIVTVVTIFGQAITFIGLVAPFLQSVSEAKGAGIEVFKLIDEASETNINENDIWDTNESDSDTLHFANDIKFENVSFAYPARADVPVLNNLTVVAQNGQTTALVGSSGCGKSTCVSLLLRFYEAASGTITINNRPINEFNRRKLRKNIGIVSQEPILFATTIYENIRYGRENATKDEIEQVANEANAHNFIMRLPNKYQTLVGERGVQLSGGEKQRIALARALIKRPSILLLDEATSALDNISEKIVQEALDRACKNRTTIVIAHRLSTIRNADKIYVLNKGQVVEEGTHASLLEQEGSQYKAMVQSQMTEKIEDDNPQVIDRNENQTEKHLSEHTHLLSDDQRTYRIEKEQLKETKRKSAFFRLLAMNKPEWFTVLIGCIVCLCAGATQPGFAILLLNLVTAFKQCTYSAQVRNVLIFGFSIIILGIVTVLIRIVQFASFGKAGSILTFRIRSKAFATYLRQEVGYFDQEENNSNLICSRLSSDALAIQQMTGTRLGTICETFAMMTIALILGGIVDWQITVILLAFLIFGFFFAFVYVKVDARLRAKTATLFDRSNALAGETIHNIRIVKQLLLEKTTLQKFADLAQQSFKTTHNYTIVLSISYTAIWSSITFAIAVIYWRVLYLVQDGKMKAENIIAVYAFAIFFMQAIRIALNLFDDMGGSISAAQYFFDLFDRTSAIDSSSTKGQQLTSFRGQIDFNHVEFSYPSRPESKVLNNFRLSIKPGQNVALVGQSGCGKSTVIQLLERFYDVSRGQLLLDGIDIRDVNIYSLRSCLGLVSQEPVLFDLTIEENIAYAKENIPMEEIIEAARKANVHDFIQRLPHGYNTRVGMKGSFLSGGEKQRIAIARAFVRQPKVLLLDEATSAMDAHNEQIVQKVLKQARIEDPNRTIITIAHRLSTIRSADLICVIQAGRIIESGTHTELMQRNGAYYKIANQNSFEP